MREKERKKGKKGKKDGVEKKRREKEIEKKK